MSRAPFIQAALRLLIVLALGGAALSARADEAAAAPEQVIKKFYAWYVGELVADRDPFTDGRAEMQRSVTPRLLKEIEGKLSEEGGLEADYFLSAQDFDKEWAENVTVSTPTTKGERATAAVELKSQVMGTQKLQVTLVQAEGAWKIDRVEGK